MHSQLKQRVWVSQRLNRSTTFRHRNLSCIPRTKKRASWAVGFLHKANVKSACSHGGRQMLFRAYPWPIYGSADCRTTPRVVIVTIGPSSLSEFCTFGSLRDWYISRHWYCLYLSEKRKPSASHAFSQSWSWRNQITPRVNRANPR